ncbi:MAG: Arginine transport system permease protein ArtQ [Chlamydiia bacterium]|nr:Arginine transport system permease protein ArtQ [Chlamydiia bacterium]
MIDYNLLINSLPSLFNGVLISIKIAFFAAFIGFILGTVFGIIEVYTKSIKKITIIYTSIVRGTPMIVQIFFIFYALPQIGIKFPPIWAAIIAIGLNSSAYVSQLIRSGLQAIPKGQLESAKLLKIPFFKQLQHIILPQTFKICWPSLGNELIILVKDSSLASIIGVIELTKQGAIIRSNTYDAFTVLLGVSSIYLLVTLSIQLIWYKIEKGNKTCYA